MMATESPTYGDTALWSRRKLVAFSVGVSLIGIVVGLFAVEVAIRYQETRIALSEQTDPGLIRYDETLGWALTPGWSGSHRHYDFDVRYTVSAAGFRHDPALPPGSRPSVLVLGDSFTFGIGVADDQTLVSRMNAEAAALGPFINLGVIGYSTDQELLLLRRFRSLYRPKAILLVLYLGNDLFDNQRAFPLQAENGKPYFELDDEGTLVLRNSPVPLSRKPPAGPDGSLTAVVLGDQLPTLSLRQRLFGGLSLSRRFGLFQEAPALDPAVFERRFAEPLRLLEALVRAMAFEAGGMGASLTVALLPGVSYVARPDSLSAQYQEALRAGVMELLITLDDVAVIDVATAMRSAPAALQRQLYFPHEGHLTADGHKFVAGVLLAAWP